MTKYSRYQSVVTRNADEGIGEDHWLKEFQKKLEKDAVQPKTQESFFDQINSIMNGTKSKYPSVAAAVEDMKERSGLMAYLNKVKASDEDKKNLPKKASDQQQVIDKKVKLQPIVIKKCPHIQNTLENYIRDTKGNLPVPAIIDKIKSIHQSDVSDAKDWDDDDLIRLVSQMNLKAKQDNPGLGQQDHNLGTRDEMNESEIDPSNTDAFNALNPVKF